MKRTPLKRGSKQLKRSGFKAKSASATKKRTTGQKSGKKTKPKGYQMPKWFKSLPIGSHGNTPAQKKYWKVLSETVRKEDFKKYKGKCCSCNTILTDWKEGDCAHWRAWSLCNAWMKFERKNLALSCKGCNRASDGVIGYRFGEELKRRHGDHILDWIESENEKYRGQKMEVWEIVERVEKLRPDLIE